MAKTNSARPVARVAAVQRTGGTREKQLFSRDADNDGGGVSGFRGFKYTSNTLAGGVPFR